VTAPVVHARRGATVAIVVHHSQGPAGQKVEDIRAFHKRPVDPALTAAERSLVTGQGWGAVPADRRPGRGYRDIAYNGLVTAAGEVVPGRPDWAVGAHAPGWNGRSYGLCLVGDFTLAPPPEVQAAQAVAWLRVLLTRYPGAQVLSHREAMALVGDPTHTDCPGPLPWVEGLRSRVGVAGVRGGRTPPESPAQLAEVGPDWLYLG
jgi:hypothetical protein